MPASGVLHNYGDNHLAAFQHFPNHAHLLVFIGGLGDGLGTVPYVRPLAEALDKLGWSTVEIQTRSSFVGWGSGSLVRDNEDILAAVEYLKDLQKETNETAKIVLMGHSTGSQNALYYASKNITDGGDIPTLDGIITQAGVSDREFFSTQVTSQDLADSLALAASSADPANTFMPAKYTSQFFPAPITAARWLDLISPKGADDFFSSDLADTDLATTFGRIRHARKLLVLYSGSDEFVPESVDKVELVSRFEAATGKEVWSEYSGIVPGATHFVGSESLPEALPNLIGRVSLFLQAL